MDREKREKMNAMILERRKKKKVHDAGRVSKDGYVYTPYIVRNGQVIWHPSGGLFKFPASQ